MRFKYAEAVRLCALSLFTSATISIAPAAAQTPAAPPLIGYVSANRILNETTEGRELNAKFRALQQEKQAEVRGIQEQMEATRKQLAQTTDPATRTKLQAQEQQLRASGERAAAQAQVELQNSQRQAQADLQARVKPVIEEIAKAKNLQLVLNGDSAVVWSAPGVDLTPAIIERLNAAAAKPAAGAKPKP